jgi:RimJ/RimL family protein N-acetyltransferase
MTDAIIRRARSTDFALLARLNAEVQELHFSNRPDQFKPVCLSDIEQWFSDLFRNPDARVWIAEVDEAPAGYIAILQQERAESPFCPARTWWEIDQIGIAAAHRRIGVCGALVEKVISEAQGQSVRAIELSAWAFNTTARRAFERLGFSPKVVRYELGTLSREGGA